MSATTTASSAASKTTTTRTNASAPSTNNNNNASNPNDIDLNTLTEEERKLYKLYGKLPTRKDFVEHRFKERKFFDSGDYALSKAGKTSSASVGSQHPSPDMIPHSHPHGPGVSSSPVKESGLAHESKVDDEVKS